METMTLTASGQATMTGTPTVRALRGITFLTPVAFQAGDALLCDGATGAVKIRRAGGSEEPVRIVAPEAAS